MHPITLLIRINIKLIRYGRRSSKKVYFFQPRRKFKVSLREASFLFFCHCVLFPFYKVQIISSSQISNVFTSAPSLENLCTVPVITSSKTVFIWVVNETFQLCKALAPIFRTHFASQQTEGLSILSCGTDYVKLSCATPHDIKPQTAQRRKNQQ